MRRNTRDKRTDEMSTKENTAVLNLSDASSEEQSSTPTTDQHSVRSYLQYGYSFCQRMFSCFPEKCTYRGLKNQGATCYLNATLQVLFMTKSFRERVMGAPSDTNEKLVSALKKIFQELSNQESGAPSVSTRGIITSLGIQNVNEQQDAVEYFLDILEKVDPTLAEVFSGTMRIIRKCSNHHESNDDSPFKSLQIPVITRDGQFKLEDGLKKYFESTELIEDDQMYCDKCKKKSDTKWSCEIQKYPEILPLHLKRFEYDYTVCGFVKNDCPMDVPLDLSLQLFQGHKYSLYAVINHTGTRFGGHYTAVIRSFTDDKWYRFDDSRVTVIDERKLKGSGEAYFLLYRKISSDTGVEDMKEVPQMKPVEPGEADGAKCGGANKPQLEVSAVTEHLMILVLSSSETKSLKVKLSKVSPESPLWQGEIIRDYICSPGPHMVLWVDPLKFKKKDFIQILFEESYRFLSNNSSKYIMIVFTSKIRPKKMLIKIAMQNYASIENNQILDTGTDMFVVQVEYVTKLPKTMNYELERKPKKRNHEKTEATHEKRASKKKMSSNQENREKST